VQVSPGLLHASLFLHLFFPPLDSFLILVRREDAARLDDICVWTWAHARTGRGRGIRPGTQKGQSETASSSPARMAARPPRPPRWPRRLLVDPRGRWRWRWTRRAFVSVPPTRSRRRGTNVPLTYRRTPPPAITTTATPTGALRSPPSAPPRLAAYVSAPLRLRRPGARTARQPGPNS
jgi:hypothetical protein